MRLSVKKAAYADLSRAAYRKSGAILGRDSRDEPVPQGRLKITQDAILGTSNSEMDHSRSGQPTLAAPSRQQMLCGYIGSVHSILKIKIPSTP